MSRTGAYDLGGFETVGAGMERAEIFEGSTDLPGNDTTTGQMSIGDQFFGTISPELDVDWIAITLTQGVSYTFLVRGDVDAPLYDPSVALIDSSGATVASDDNSGRGLNSAVNFTPSSTDTYFIAVSATLEDVRGRYVVEALEGTYGSLEVMGEQLAKDYHTEDNSRPRRWEETDDLTVDLSTINGNGKKLARWALETWSEYTGITFSETNSNADITFDDDQQVSGLPIITPSTDLTFGTAATLPNGLGQGAHISSAEINIHKDYISANGTTIDSDSYLTYLQMIGEALGFGYLSNSSGSNFESDALFINDSLLTSVMSRFDAKKNTFVDGSKATPTTLGEADIAASQLLYDLNPNVNNGNTVYGAKSNVGGTQGDLFEVLFDGKNDNSLYDGGAVSFTIYDTGGIDAIDVSTVNKDQVIDLRSGGVSSVAGFTRNLVIAENSDTIEDAEGGKKSDTIYGNEAANVLLGNKGADVITGIRGDDVVKGGKGNDLLRGGEGDDQVEGGEGNDDLFGGAGDDTVIGGDGDDDMQAGFGEDRLEGGDGNDTLGGGDDKDVLIGDKGNDILRAGDGNDNLNGGKGSDVLNGGLGKDKMKGGAGNDRYIVDHKKDKVTEKSGEGNDTVSTTLKKFKLKNNVENLEFGDDSKTDFNGTGNDANNSITGSQKGSNTLNGGLGNDVIFGGSKRDTIFGDEGQNASIDGNDEIRGRGGNDAIRGDGGNDKLYGDAGNDEILGGDGDDMLFGGDGADNMNGDIGNDQLNGGSGNDRLQGRDGSDILTGGSGKDTFVFDARKNNGTVDRITDYSAANDTLELRNATTSVTVSNSGGDSTVTYRQSDNNAARTIILEDVTLSRADLDIDFI